MAKVLSARCKPVSVKDCLEQHENRSCVVSERRVQDCRGNVCTSQLSEGRQTVGGIHLAP